MLPALTLRSLLTSICLSRPKSYPIIMADMDHKGSLLAQCVHHFTPAWKSRVQVQVRCGGRAAWLQSCCLLGSSDIWT